MINKGSTINVVSAIALFNLKIPISYLSAPTLSIRDFNNTSSTTLGVVVIPIKVGVRCVHTTYHVVEGEMQYNIILGIPWIDEMEVDISSSKHGCINYLYEGNTHCIHVDPNPFINCNLI